MACTVVNSQSSLQSRTPILNTAMPKTEADWARFLSLLNGWAQVLKQEQHAPNVVPAEFQTFTTAAAAAVVAALMASNCTPSVDATQQYYGAASLKVVVAATGATLRFAGTPISMDAASRWFASFQILATAGLSGSLSVIGTTNTVTESFTVPAAAGWQQVWGLFDFRKFADVQGAWEFTFNTVGTVWIDGMQMNSVGDPIANLPAFSGTQMLVGAAGYASNLDGIPNGTTRFATINGGGLNAVSAVDAANRALIDFSQAGHTNKGPYTNANITITASGALVGGGGGTVTITGLGYTGALNATYGATWGSNVSGIPANLSVLTGAEAIQNALISISAGGVLSGAGGGTVTLSGLGAGALATKSNVAATDLVSTIKAIEIVSSLPTAGTAGRTVYLTTSGKLYRDNGASWVQLGTGNLVDASTWVDGTAGSQPGWVANPTSTGGSNQVLIETAPDAWYRDVWRATSGSAAGTNAEGGWNSNAFPIDPSKMYRFSVWVRVLASQTGQFYLGCNANTVADIPSGTTDTNPYFLGGIAHTTLTLGRWYLAVGYVYPSSYAGAQNQSGGLYDGLTGQRIANATDFKWVAGATSTVHRAFQYYTNAAGEISDFWDPRVELCDGSEGSVQDLLATAMLSALNPITASNYSQVISAGAINADRIAANTITAAQIAASTITAAQIAANTITASLIAAGAIGTAELAAGAVTAAQIAANTITASQIAAATITAAQIAAGTITATQIANSTITNTQIAAGTITGAAIAGGTITNANIAGGTITGTQIAASTIDATKLTVATLSAIAANLGTITAGTVIFDNGTNMMVEGIGFGASSDLLLWYGPHQASISTCTKANGYFYLATDGTSCAVKPASTTTYTASTTVTIPAGVSTMVVELWGDTGPGMHGYNALPSFGGGGGSGAYCRSTYSVVGKAGQTLTLTLQAGGSGSNSTITAGTMTGFTTMTAPGGLTGTAGTSSGDGTPGLGAGIASGGNQVNAPGNDGGNSVSCKKAGPAVIGVHATGNPGGLGNDTNATNNPGLPAVAAVTFT